MNQNHSFGLELKLLGKCSCLYFNLLYTVSTTSWVRGRNFYLLHVTYFPLHLPLKCITLAITFSYNPKYPKIQHFHRYPYSIAYKGLQRCFSLIILYDGSKTSKGDFLSISRRSDVFAEFSIYSILVKKMGTDGFIVCWSMYRVWTVQNILHFSK